MIEQIGNEYLKVQVKDFGAELCSLVSLKNNKEYLWQADKQFWGKHAPILFPVVGFMKDNKYTYAGEVYNMSKHGFARDMIFELVEKSNVMLTYRLVSNAETLRMYPFEFELLVRYGLEGEKLEITYGVLNKDTKPMYFSIGAHPAFNCNMKEGNKFLEFELEEELETRVINMENGLIENETKPILMGRRDLSLSYDLFKNDALVFENIKSEYVAIRDEDENERIKMTMKGFPYFAVWSPPAPFLCLEPWYGIADFMDSNGKIQEKVGIQSLEAKGEFTCSYSIEIEHRE